MMRYDSYKDSGVEWIGEIPSHWEDPPLRYYFSYTKGSIGQKLTKSYVEDNRGEYPVYSGQTDNDGIMGFVNEYEFDYHFPLIFTTTVGAKYMTTRILQGRFSLSQNCLVMVKKKECVPSFVEYFLKIDFQYRKELIPIIIQPSLRMEDLDRVNIVVPPLPEQQQIVSYLDTKTSQIDTLIEKTQRKIHLLKENRTSLINEVVTKGLNPNVEMKDSGVEWIGEIPSHWEFTRIKYFVNFDSGYTFKSEDYSDNGIPLIRIGSLYNNTLSFERSPIFLPEEFERDYNQFVIEKNDILISMTGTLGKRDYGYSILYNEEFPSLLNQRVGRIRLSSERVNLNYLMYNLLSEPFLLQLFSKPTGTKQGNLSSDDIIGNYFGLPPISEQNEIVSYLDEHTQLIDKTISVEERRIEFLKEYRQSLISEVVTGKIDVRLN